MKENQAYVFAKAFQCIGKQQRKIMLDNFEEAFRQCPDIYRKAIYKALSTDIKMIPEFI